MDYLNHFGLTLEPFSNTPSDTFFVHSSTHDIVLKKLHHAVETMKGLAVIEGDIGTGKTTLARKFLSSLPSDRHDTSLLVITRTDISPNWLLKHVARQLDIPHNDIEAPERLTEAIFNQLVTRQAAGKKVIILIDEAQMLNTKALTATLRGLVNMEMPDKKLLTLILFGTPDLEKTLRIDPALLQRVAIRHQLNALNLESTLFYIRERLHRSGCKIPIFSDSALQLVYKFSEGIPRKINTLCDNVLLEAFFNEQQSVQEKLIFDVAVSLKYGLGGHSHASQSTPSPLTIS